MPLKVDLQQDVERITSENVLGYVEGSDLKDELLVVTAHYDHIGKRYSGRYYPGADDNASGVSAILDIARGLI